MSDFQTPVKGNAKRPGADHINIPPSPALHRLGYGTGISVMQLLRSPCAGQVRSPWALKMLNKKVKMNPVYSTRLQEEADLLKSMSHPNIVGFRAFSKTKILYLGMESCDGSLGDLIEKRAEEDPQPFSPRHILKVAIDTCRALDYIHTKAKILHGDMKSYNILVNGNFDICKLCDFGVSLPLDENGILDKEKAGLKIYYGTDLWSAPEVLNGGQITSKSDLFSFGLVLWEMLALMPPHSLVDESVSMDDSVICLDDTMENDLLKQCGTRPLIPSNIDEEFYSDPLALIYCCTEQTPQMRPSAAHIVLCAEDMMTRAPSGE